MKKITRLLIANRGEIALRIIRACKELGIESVVAFSEADANGLWVARADEAYPVMGNPVEAYLSHEKIIEIAKRSACDAIHPGYGFLSESEEFAKACEKEGIIFVGPKAEHIGLFGDKMASKVAIKKLGVPVLEGTDEPIEDIAEGERVATEIGFPVIIKAAFGGGGRGMRIVRKAEEFQELFESAKNESLKYFAKGEMFIEKYVENPRHIEIQVVADKYGNVIHLGERDCSIQRRHQKVIEITPSPKLSAAVREKLAKVSVDAMKKMGYESVGTVEFLVDAADNAYFIEMNTRVQVEHPVTEQVSGIDIIKTMIEIADEQALRIQQSDVLFRGYAIEFRINSEDPANNFMPTTGTLQKYATPAGPGVRVDSALYEGYALPTCYDSMIGKLIISDITWEATLKRAKRALEEFILTGVKTNIPLHRAIIEESNFIAGDFDTSYLDKRLKSFDLTNGNEIDDTKRFQELRAVVEKLNKAQEEEEQKRKNMEETLKKFFTLY